ncbi:Membrane protein involved in the export of O-antigen and teichoic acid [Butyrivibrio fibrisolvens DSM 3071]|uniref:Membrane protein involved in the export of O-antigen and teichoic acid n=1 Tax=Butyrivibrio fibrisolvens DSM 3071 TaxID=1121131 RepID=A0A1M5SYZ1_BUTFI|nr:oligosaccharide flippase family protein [Butyrivibrio fibrisolvens]SHH43747.1 Membrane protein involved in the export of O-antigen and teichoic acid [Butyrivibrio fibrisolvens DSM 3071]
MRLLGRSESTTLILFVKNFLLLFAFRGISVLTNLVVTILAGRTLTVELMGEYNLVFTLANILVIPLIMGVNNTLLKVLPESSDDEKKEILGTVIIGNFMLCLGLSVIGYIITPIVCRFPNLTPESWYLAIALAIATNSCILADTILKVDEKFFRLGIAKIAGSIFMMAGYLVSILAFNKISIYVYIICNVLGQVLALLVSVYKLGAVKFIFRRDIAKDIFKIGVFYMFSWLLTTGLNTADICIISALRPEYESGIFSSYQSNIRIYFSVFYNDIFAAVMLPTLINHGVDIRRLVGNVFKFMPVILLILGAGTATLLVALLYAYGEQYPIIWGYIILEAAGIAFQGIYYFFSSLLVMEGETGARTSFEILGKPYVFLLLISFVCTKLFGLTGGFISFTANQAILAVLLVIRYRRTLRIGESEEKHYSFYEI